MPTPIHSLQPKKEFRLATDPWLTVVDDGEKFDLQVLAFDFISASRLQSLIDP
jgi:hypothetical protein